MVLGVTALGILFVISARARAARRATEQPSLQEAIAQIRAAGRVANDATVQEAELLDTAQRLTAQMDARICAVEQLLEEADIRIAELKRLTAGAAAPSRSPSPLAAAPSTPRMPAAAAHPLAGEIYALADQGHDATEIARRLDEQTGKVQLILALRRHTMAT
jgi:hypothetical protein